MNDNTNPMPHLATHLGIVKNMLLVTLMFLCLIPPLRAQYPYNSVHGIGGGNYLESIVRMYSANEVIVYLKNPYNNNGSLALVDILTGDKYSVDLDPDFIGYDMSITNDTVFLCGSIGDDTSHRGCIVYMYVPDLYSSTATVTYYEPSYWMRSVITKIASYKDAAPGIKIACVGEFYYSYAPASHFPGDDPFNTLRYTYYNPVTHPTCTVNFAMAMTIPSPGYYISTRLFRMVNPFEHPSEKLLDVVVTDNYVAFVGFDYGPTKSITLHACPKTNSSTLTPITFIQANDAFGNYTAYALSNGGSPYYIATALRGDSIAIAATGENTLGSYDDIWLRTFELNSMQMTHAQYIRNDGGTKLKDMTYLLNSWNVELLYNGSHTCCPYVDMFCCVNPYNTATIYTAPLKTLNNDENYTSIDMLKGEYFVSTGGDFGLVERSTNYPPQCPKDLNIDIKKGDVLSGVPLYFDYDQSYPHPWITPIVEMPQHSYIQVDCYNVYR